MTARANVSVCCGVSGWGETFGDLAVDLDGRREFGRQEQVGAAARPP